ncbi:uncharacterized protein V6R79_018424 [Siganus canaliculatus]
MRLGSSSRNLRGYQYRTRAANSEVDETLFGSPSRVSSKQDHHPQAKKESQKRQDAEIIQIIGKDFIRNLRIPFKDPSGSSTILPLAEFERIASTSRNLTKEQRKAVKEAQDQKTEEETRAREERRLQLLEADQSSGQNMALSDMELEAQECAQHMVERAKTLIIEQEEEIKHLNKLILDAQCQATRDAQIQVRKQIETELSEEEKRLDAMMEVERLKALEAEEQIEELRKQQRMRGLQQIHDQIQIHQEEKLLQEEMKELQKQQLRQEQEEMNLEDLDALQRKRERQQQLHEEVMRINAETMRAKEQRREEEKMADMRDMEYMKKKLEREAEFKAEQEQIKKDKELEIARLWAQQKRAKDYLAEQDELRARRHQESIAREWRRKEKELAEKKAQEKAMLREARLEQVRCKEHLLSMEAGREKAEFERVLKVQQEAIRKESSDEERQRQKAHQHAKAIRQQVKERELSAVAKRREVFAEADRLVQEARQRRMRLDEIKERKLKELRATGLSEIYCAEVERKTRAHVLK